MQDIVTKHRSTFLQRAALTSAICSATLAWAAAPAAKFVDIEPVWAAHPTDFCLLTHPPFQFVAYYDAQRQMSVAQRALNSTNWTITKLPSKLAWDSHNYVTMMLDRKNFLHVAGNMHCVPLIYFRSTKPLDASSLVRITAMTGKREQSVTYPVFLRDKSDQLIFRYRDGRSGKGDDLYNVYDEQAQAWTPFLSAPLMSGQGKMNAYATLPKLGPDGRFHVVWVWRNQSGCEFNHDISYAYSEDLQTWYDMAGQPLALPITVQQRSTIIDPVPPHGGILNGHCLLGFDNAQRVVVTYHKYDAQGDLQIYAARYHTNAWKIVQVSDWKGYRWDFGGGGSIVSEVNLGAVEPLGNDRLALTYRSGRGSGTWILDETTLRPIPGATPPRRKATALPNLGKLESVFPGMQKHRIPDSGTAPASTRYMLTWEALPANRDQPRIGPLPESSMLRLIEIHDVLNEK